jgi:hypothetical protein
MERLDLGTLVIASSSFLINGEPGRKIHHRRVRQGDPLSLMIFLLAMEPLHMLFQYAHNTGMLSYLHANCATFRMLLYADDAVVFINPTANDLLATKHILQLFGEAAGLITNLDKTEYFPIRCQNINIGDIIGLDQNVAAFPCSYLGLPLHFKKLPKSAIQSIVHKIGNRLPGWKRKLMTYPGRELLVKTILSSMPTHFLTVYKLPTWAAKDIDSYRRSFLWRGDEPEKKIKGALFSEVENLH